MQFRVRRTGFVCLYTIIVFFFGNFHAVAQTGISSPPQRSVMRGEVSCPDCQDLTALSVEVHDLQRNQVVEHVPVHLNGFFELRNSPSGTFRVVVVAETGAVVTQEIVSLQDHSGTLALRVPERRTSRPGTGTVSVTRLRHKVPGAARKEYGRAEKCLSRGDAAGSLAHLLKAVEIDPEYLEALNNMGARYMQLGQPGNALDAFNRAARIDPGVAMLHANMSIALLHLRRPVEAELEARQAVSLDGSAPQGHYLLGLCLFQQKKFTPEAMANLRGITDSYPRASLVLAQMLAEKGSVQEARAQLTNYLQSGNADRRQEVEALLMRLK